MEQPTISVTVHTESTQQFAGVLVIEDKLEDLLTCQEALTFDADSCILLLNHIKDLKWNKFRVCQHLRLHLLLLRLKSYGRIDLENSNHSKAAGKLKNMRKLCRFILRQFMVIFDTVDFDVFEKQIRKYEAVVSGFPLTLWYLADEKLADAIANDFRTKKMSRAQRFFYDYCLHIDLEQFVNETNIQKLLENEIRSICEHENEKIFHLSKIHDYEEVAFSEFLNLEESWCWTTLSNLTFKDHPSKTTSDYEYDDPASIVVENTNDVQSPEPIVIQEIEPTTLTLTDNIIYDAMVALVNYNRALLQADLSQINSFLLSTGTIQPENLLEQFFAYKNKQKSTQTEDNDTDSTQRSNKSFGTIHDDTQMVESTFHSQQLMFADNSIFASSQLARILDDHHTVSQERLLNENRTTPAPINKPTIGTAQIETSACFTKRNHLTFSQISEIDFHIACPLQCFTINLKFFGNCDCYCLTENSVCQLLNVNAEQWQTLRKVFAEVGIFEYKANQQLPRDCSQLHKYLYYLFKNIDLVKDCISFVPDMHSNHLLALRESNFIRVQRQALRLDDIIDNEVLQKMCKKQ